MAEAAALVRTFRVGKRTCTITMQRPVRGAVSHMVVEWSPAVPRRLSKRELRQYRAGRDALVAEAAAALGGPALVVEV